MSADTRQRLLDGALATLRQHGVAGVSARTIAAAAGVNQALVFYHFGSVDELLAAACDTASKARVEVYAIELARVQTLRDLLDVGRRLHEEERRLGNVMVMAQMLAGAQGDARLAEPSARALRQWTGQIEATLARVLAGSPVAEVADIPGLARAVSAGFIGLELYEAVDAAGAQRALSALEQLAVLVEVVEDLGSVALRALRAKVRKTARASSVRVRRS
jgi:AcrR family transcriptional regulator